MKIIAFSLFCFVIASSGYSQSAREISDKAAAVIDFPAMEMAATLRIIDTKDRERTRELKMASLKVDGVSKSLMKFTAPADVSGTGILVVDYDDREDDMWIYLPALRKTRRIVSSEKGKSFMGSEFSNADMSKPKMDDFTYKTLGEEILNGKPCWKIEVVAKNQDIEDSYGFTRKISWIEKGNYLCHKVELYNFDKQLSKVQEIKDYRKQSNGRFFAFGIEMDNVQNGRRSVLEVNQFQIGSTLSDASFTPAMLEK